MKFTVTQIIHLVIHRTSHKPVITKKVAKDSSSLQKLIFAAAHLLTVAHIYGIQPCQLTCR